ncbi:YciI family protein [Demequina gelatinilytica]|uniref:YciI family protein n=1 Tax=Demequina gelatinilytica TaxID=1638980 RepID=UPI000785F3F5|nr:YciI family protein [Demequina gelatinilytica]
MHAVLEYTFRDDHLTARLPYRAEHLAYAWAAVDRGEMILGGAAGDGPFTGLMIFTGEDPIALAAAHAAADPYVLHEVATSWRVLPWATVVGHDAADPVRP